MLPSRQEQGFYIEETVTAREEKEQDVKGVGEEDSSRTNVRRAVAAPETCK